LKIVNFKNGFVTVGLMIMMLLSMPFASNLIIRAQTADQIYEQVSDVPQKEYALVLGAAAYGDKLSDILKDRVDTAIELYNAKITPNLIMSGASNETAAMKNYAVEKGIPEEAILEDPTGVNTLASIKNISADKSIVIVSQKYHLPRALFLADHFGLDAVGITADKHEYIKIFEFKKRELLATTKAVMDVILGEAFFR
jgi:SanA protein